MAGCQQCGERESLNYSCNYCSGEFCKSHRLPENHNCPGLRSATTLGPEFRGSDSSGSLLSGVFNWGSINEGDAIAREHHPGMKTYDGDLNASDPIAPETESIPTGYDPQSSPDINPDGSIARSATTTEATANASLPLTLKEGAWTLVGMLILVVVFPFRLLSELPALLARFNRWLAQLLDSLYGIAKTLAPVAILIVGALFVAGLIGTGVPAIDDTSNEAADRLSSLANSTGDDGMNETLVQQEFAQQLNSERQDRGLNPLTTSQILRAIGEDHAENMRKHDYIGHVQPDGTTIEDRYRDRGLLPKCQLSAGDGSFYNGAENAAGAHIGESVTHPGTTEYFHIDTETELAAFLLDSWMTSDGHRRVLLLESANEIGLGLAIADDGSVYAALEFC